MLSCPKGLSRRTMALWHLSEVEMRHGVPLSRRSAVRLMSRMSALYSSRVVSIILASILLHVHVLWGPFCLSHSRTRTLRVISFPESQVQIYKALCSNGFRLLTTCSWNKKSSWDNPSFFPGHLISAAEGEDSSHFIFHGKCFGLLPFFEPGQVQRWLLGDLNCSEIKRSLLAQSMHSIFDPRTLW